MKKIHQYILTKDFIIRGLAGIITIILLFFTRETYSMTKKFIKQTNNNTTQIKLVKKDIEYLSEGIIEIKIKLR